MGQLKENSINGNISQKGGILSTKQIPADIETKVVAILQCKYSGFGPTFAHAYLTDK